MGAEYGAGKLEAAGHEQLAGGAGVASGVLAVGSAAATGAAIGSFILPGFGTIAGAITFGLGGLLSQWKNIGSSFMKMIGSSKEKGKDKEQPRQYKGLLAELETIKVKEAGEMTRQSDINKKQKENIELIGKEGIASVYGGINNAINKLREQLDGEKKKVDIGIAKALMARFSDITINVKSENIGAAVAEEIEKQEEKINNLQSIFDEQVAKGYINTKEKDEDEKILDIEKKRLENYKELIKEQEEQYPTYEKLLKQIDLLEVQQEQISGFVAQQRTLVGGLSSLYETQVGNIDAIIEKMSIAGQIDVGAAFDSVKEGLRYLNAEISAQRTLGNILSQNNNDEKMAALEKAANNAEFLTADQKMFKELVDIGIAGLDQLSTEDEILKTRKAENALLKQKTELLGKIGNIYADTLRLVRAQSTGVSLLVQLADNYAIGVGASAQLRMKEFYAQGQVIEGLRAQLQVEKQAYILSVQGGGSDKENLRLRTKIIEIENEMLEAQIKQASSVKAMRDGWISAISAMNTGMDGFSEIIMNAEQNTAQIQSLNGAVKSSLSGAYDLKDAFGRIIERVGFQGSEVMNLFGDIHGKMGRLPGEMPYITPGEIRAGLSREKGGFRETLEAAERGETIQVVEKTLTDAQYAVGGGLMALAATSNQWTLGVQAGLSSFQKTIMDSGTKAGGSISKAGEDFSEKTGQSIRGMQEISRGTSRTGAGAGAFSMGGGIMDIKLEPSETDEKWQKALSEAPRDTISSLVVNKEADAVPVFVVNLNDLRNIKGSVPTTKEIIDKQEQAAAAKEKPIKSTEIVQEVQKKAADLKTGSIEITSLVNRGQKLRISEILEMEGISDKGKEFLKYLQMAGLVYVEIEDIQDALLRSEKELADVKTVVAKREMKVIGERKKQLEKLEVKKEKAEKENYFPYFEIEEIGELSRDISNREKSVETTLGSPVSTIPFVVEQNRLEELKKKNTIKQEMELRTAKERRILKEKKFAAKKEMEFKTIKERRILKERKSAAKKETEFETVKGQSETVKRKKSLPKTTKLDDSDISSPNIDNIQTLINTKQDEMNKLLDQRTQLIKSVSAFNFDPVKLIRIMQTIFQGLEGTIGEKLTKDF
jgi:hypothetical protein